jgi:hypothetical protein
VLPVFSNITVFGGVIKQQAKPPREAINHLGIIFAQIKSIWQGVVSWRTKSVQIGERYGGKDRGVDM